MNYKQNIWEFTANYLNNCFEVATNQLCGTRKTFNNGSLVQINDSCEPNNCYEFNKMNFLSFKNLLEKIQKQISKDNIDFISYIKYHDEFINVGRLTDRRNFGYIKASFKDERNNIDTFDINFCINDDYYYLEDKIISCANQYCQKRKFIDNKRVKSVTLTDMPIVFSQLATGYFVHEILGHLLEEDIFKACNYAIEKFNMSPKLTIQDKIDEAGQYIGLNKYDDEGHNILPLVLIEKGKLKNIMAVNTKNSLDNALYGFARRETFKHNVQSRMRCTVVKPVDNLNKNKIIEKLKKAVLLNRVYFGSTNPKDTSYTLKGNGYLIENGEIVNYIGNMILVGELLKDLNKVEYVGNDVEFNTSDCVKFGQVVRVGMLAPTISISDSSIKGELYY